MEKLNNFELCVNYGSHILLSHFPSICTFDRLYIHLAQVNPDKKYRSLPGISVILSVILYLEIILGHFIYLEIFYSDLGNGSTEVSQVQC